MRLEALFRYPVKSMAGERLESAELRLDGVAGDRRAVVVDRSGRVVTSRTRPRLLAHAGSLGLDGAPLVDGRNLSDPSVARDVEAAAGAGARLVLVDEPDVRFDILPLLVATDGAVAAFGRDIRRLRPNLLIGGVEGLAERDWEGRLLKVGEALVRLDDLRARCVMTTWDPDTQAQDLDVLRDIQRRFGGRLALNAAVVKEGRVRVGDTVSLVEG